MLIKILYFIFSRLPNTFSQIMGLLAGRIFYWVNGRERRIATINIALCFPELSADQQKELIKKTLIENAKTLLEMPRIFYKGGEYSHNLVTSVEGIDCYHDAIAANKGVILLAPHLGNWELIAHYLNKFSPMTVMFAPPKKEFLNEIMRKARESSGATLVPADPTGVRALLKQLKKGGVVGILPDQQPKHGHAKTYAPFMGNNAATMLLVNNLAKRTNATIVYVFVERQEIGQGYKVRIIPAPEDLAASDETIAATQLNLGIENCVRLAPSQYQWTYKRFRIQPEGQKSPYD